MQARTEKVDVRCAAIGVAMLCAALVGCGSDDDAGDSPTPAPTATAAQNTPTQPPGTPQPTETPAPTNTPVEGAAVRGVLVVDDAVDAGAGDALGAAPESDFIGPGFDRSLSFADWVVECTGLDEIVEGTTDESGRFAIPDLPPGDCTLHVTKTVGGDLMTFEIPFTVGDDGAAEVVAEVSWGRIRAVSTYVAGGADVRRVWTNGGLRMLVRDGRIAEIGDYRRRLIDDDGDGMFESPSCDERVWQCSEFGECGEDRRCACTASCPFCDDCGPPVCVPEPYSPYRCDGQGGCAHPSDRCVCASSAPDATDCPQRVCIPSCAPVSLDGVRIFGPESLVAGQQGSFGATGSFSDGSTIDVSGLVDWSSSDDAILEIGSWGTARAVAAGTAELTASLEDLDSDPYPVVVTARPALVAIHLQNYDCYPVPLGEPQPVPFPDVALIDPDFAPPSCADAIEIGGTIRFSALGEFQGGFYDDVTGEVEWSAIPAAAGSIDQSGLLTGVGEGTVSVTASLDGVTSEAREVRVVAERSVVSISIYPESRYYADFLPVADAVPCYEFACSGSLTLLVGDEVQFRATARYDVGGWEDVTEQVTWSSGASGVASISQGGLLTAAGAGATSVTGAIGDVESAPYGVEVVAEATLQQLEIYQEGDNAGDRVIETGGQAFFHAQGYYDVGFGRDATADATWRTSDESVARFEEPGVLLGLSAGSVAVWAELDGVESRTLFIEVFAQSDIEFCDVENVNRGTWTDGFNRVYLESDCDTYTQPDVVQIRFTVTETERPVGIFDPCLDLYAFRVEEGVETFVRTIREEGCGEPFLDAAAPGFDEAELRYQLQAFWDLKDDSGGAVPPGTYRIKGRFYLYYDPVVTIDVAVE